MKLKKSMLSASVTLLMLSGIAQAADEISVYGKGDWVSDVLDHGTRERKEVISFWLDAKVKNIGYHKSVTMVWTDDNWNTVVESPLSYEHSLGGEYEQWGVDIDPMGYQWFWYNPGLYNYHTGNSTPGTYSSCMTIEFYLKYQVNGVTYYGRDNGGYYTHGFGTGCDN